MGHLTVKNKTLLEEKTVHVPEIRWSNSLFTKKTLDILWKLCGKISGPSPPTRIEQLYARLPGKCVEEI